MLTPADRELAAGFAAAAVADPLPLLLDARREACRWPAFKLHVVEKADPTPEQIDAAYQRMKDRGERLGDESALREQMQRQSRGLR